MGKDTSPFVYIVHASSVSATRNALSSHFNIPNDVVHTPCSHHTIYIYIMPTNCTFNSHNDITIPRCSISPHIPAVSFHNQQELLPQRNYVDVGTQLYCVGPITRPEDSYRKCVCVCERERERDQA